jgi:hypothetical protein
MGDALLSVAGGLLNSLLGAFTGPTMFGAPLDTAFAAWKVLFFFIAAGSVFLAQDRRGLIAALAVGVLAALVLGWNHKSSNAFPPWWSATDISWFSFQLAQACAVGIVVRLAKFW